MTHAPRPPRAGAGVLRRGKARFGALGGSLGAAGRGLLDLLLPPRCAGCGGDPGEAPPLCPRCAAGLPAPLAEDPPAPLPLVAAVAAVPFEGGWETWIRRFKYPAAGLRGLDPAAEAVAVALLRRAAARAPGPAPDAVVPVALHRHRVRARGLHPPALLARVLARELGRPHRPDLLRRVRDTPSQTGLSRAERRRNVAGVFTARPAPARIWLVDDVVTTGATLAAAARALRRAGAREVVGVCCARTTAPGALLPLRVEPAAARRYKRPASSGGPRMATITQAITLKHQANLGEEVEEVSFAEGEEVTVLKAWDDRVLCKNGEGKLFNVPKDALDA